MGLYIGKCCRLFYFLHLDIQVDQILPHSDGFYFRNNHPCIVGLVYQNIVGAITQLIVSPNRTWRSILRPEVTKNNKGAFRHLCSCTRYAAGLLPSPAADLYHWFDVFCIFDVNIPSHVVFTLQLVYWKECQKYHVKALEIFQINRPHHTKPFENFFTNIGHFDMDDIHAT